MATRPSAAGLPDSPRAADPQAVSRRTSGRQHRSTPCAGRSVPGSAQLARGRPHPGRRPPCLRTRQGSQHQGASRSPRNRRSCNLHEFVPVPVPVPVPLRQERAALAAGLCHLLLGVGESALERLYVVSFGLADDFLGRAGYGRFDLACSPSAGTRRSGRHRRSESSPRPAPRVCLRSGGAAVCRRRRRSPHRPRSRRAGVARTGRRRTRPRPARGAFADHVVGLLDGQVALKVFADDYRAVQVAAAVEDGFVVVASRRPSTGSRR